MGNSPDESTALLINKMTNDCWAGENIMGQRLCRWCGMPEMGCAVDCIFETDEWRELTNLYLDPEVPA